jgi:ABC-type phosphate transport system substrate-binding protein
MSAFKQKLARLGATAGVLAVTTAAVLAVGGAEASSALALGHCTNTEEVKGEGSSLQREAQATLNTAFNVSANAQACNGTQGSGQKPPVKYTVTSSGTALKEWGVGSGSLGTNGVNDNFVGSDDAPSGTASTGQIKEIITALRAHGTTNTTNLVSIPVTQTSIAVLVNLPEGCTLTKITNVNLEEIFRGTLKTWKGVTNASPTTTGGACDHEIKRVVRTDGSGTTYQFKHYLFGQHTPKICTTEYPSPNEMTWAELQNESAVGTHTPNLVWPDCSGTTPIIRPAATGGGALVKEVSETDSSIGYAALPDAESANKTAAATILEVQDGETFGTKEYALPNAAGSTANCSEIKYSPLPSNAGTPVSTWELAGTTANLDWSGVYGSNPGIKGGLYPICTLTWDEAATNSTAVWGTNKATTVHDYLKFAITPAGGQAEITPKWYAKLPNSTLSTSSNVQLAAEKAVEQIG